MPKHSSPSFQGCHGTLPSPMYLLTIIPSLLALVGRPYSPASTPMGLWQAGSEVNQLPRSPPVSCQNWLCIANASLLADHPCNASIRLCHVTRSPCSWFEDSPLAACLSPSLSGHVLLECEPILTFKKK